MIEFSIPGRGAIRLQHLVSDVNGTLALDGQLIEGVVQRLAVLRQSLTLHLLTADTHGNQTVIDDHLGLIAIRIRPAGEAAQKADYIRNLGSDTVVAIGQGANDAEMLAAAGLGICVLAAEGAARESVQAADVVVPDILAALDLLLRPLRLKATLRK